MLLLIQIQRQSADMPTFRIKLPRLYIKQQSFQKEEEKSFDCV